MRYVPKLEPQNSEFNESGIRNVYYQGYEKHMWCNHCTQQRHIEAQYVQSTNGSENGTRKVIVVVNAHVCVTLVSGI